MTTYEYEALVNQPGKYKLRNIYTKKDERVYISPRTSSVFVFAKNSCTRGSYISKETALNIYHVPDSVKNPGKSWERRLRRAIDMLEASGVNDKLKNIYLELLLIGYEDFAKLRKLKSFNYGAPDPDNEQLLLLKELMAKYPFAFTDRNEVDSTYTCELCDCMIKAINFGKFGDWERNRASSAIRERRREYFQFDNGSYDCYFSFNPGESSAVYAEEYRGTGNGHYYLVLDEKHCVFYEND